MKKRFVISNLPVRFPIQSTILYSFLLYYFKADGLWWGIFICLYSILWIIAIAVKWNEESIDLNADDLKGEKKKVQSKFAERLQQMQNKQTTK